MPTVESVRGRETGTLLKHENRVINQQRGERTLRERHGDGRVNRQHQSNVMKFSPVTTARLPSGRTQQSRYRSLSTLSPSLRSLLGSRFRARELANAKNQSTGCSRDSRVCPFAAWTAAANNRRRLPKKSYNLQCWQPVPTASFLPRLPCLSFMNGFK